METVTGMRLFARVVESGNFSEAGRRLGLAPSSISRQINALEDALGARLMNRTTRKLSLTEAGQLYYQHAARILADIEEANMAVSELEAAPRGVLRLNVPVVFGRLHIAPALPDFLERNPAVTIDLTMTDNVVDVVEEGADLAIRIAELKDSTLIARRLAPSRRLICASPAYLDRHGRPQSPQDVASHNCLTYKFSPGQSQVWRLRGADDGLHEIRVKGNLQSNNSEALYAAAKAGLGLAMLTTWTIAEDVRSGTLEVVLPDYEASPTDLNAAIYAVYPHNRHLSAKVRAFIDFMVERFGKPGYWQGLCPDGSAHRLQA